MQPATPGTPEPPARLCCSTCRHFLDRAGICHTARHPLLTAIYSPDCTICSHYEPTDPTAPATPLPTDA